MRNLLFFIFVWSLAACSSIPNSFADDLDTIIEDYEALGVTGEDADSVGSDEISPDWPDISPDHAEETTQDLQELLDRLNALDTAALNEDDKINYGILKTIVSDAVTLAAFDETRIPFTGDWGFQADIVFDISRTRLKNADDVRALIARMENAPAYLDAHIVNMKRGLATGFVSYQDPLDTVMEQIRDQLSKAPEETDLYTPFTSLPAGIPSEEAEQLRADGLEATKAILAGFQKALDFLENEYSPQTRADAGVMNLPQGREYYKAVLAMHTTRSDLTPEDVHDVGKSEVARIRAEMEAIIEEVGYEGSFSDFLTYLRTDPKF